MKVRITMEFTPEQVLALSSGEPKLRRGEVEAFMKDAVWCTLPEAMKNYRQVQINNLQGQIKDLKAQNEPEDFPG